MLLLDNDFIHFAVKGRSIEVRKRNQLGKLRSVVATYLTCLQIGFHLPQCDCHGLAFPTIEQSKEAFEALLQLSGWHNPITKELQHLLHSLVLLTHLPLKHGYSCIHSYPAFRAISKMASLLGATLSHIAASRRFGQATLSGSLCHASAGVHSPSSVPNNV